MTAANISYQATNIGAVIASMEQRFSVSDKVCKPIQKFLIKLDALPCGRTVFRFDHQIELVIYQESDGMWICESELLSSLTYGDTPTHAVQALCDELAVLWKEIAMSPDDNLTPDAQRLKIILLSSVKAVEKGK